MTALAGSVLIRIDTQSLSWRPFRYEYTSNITKPLYERWSSEEWNPAWLPQREETFYVGLHIRQGDITAEKRDVRESCEKAVKAKYVPAVYYVKVLQTVLRLLPKKPVVILFSESSPREAGTNAEVEEIVAWLQLHQVAHQAVVGGPNEAAKSFHMMTRVDLLVVGSSGFGRLAASLSLGGIVVALESVSHPLFRLPYVETVVCQGSQFLIAPGAEMRLRRLLARQKLDHQLQIVQLK